MERYLDPETSVNPISESGTIVSRRILDWAAQSLRIDCIEHLTFYIQWDALSYSAWPACVNLAHFVMCCMRRQEVSERENEKIEWVVEFLLFSYIVE